MKTKEQADAQEQADVNCEEARRGLRAAREFLNGLPLNDGASARAIDREFIVVDLIPKGLNAIDALVARVEELEKERRRIPSNEGGPGHEEMYWLRAKLNAAITQLRYIEDYYRLKGGTPDSFNMERADRARSIYEQITVDFIHGRMGTPITAARVAALERHCDKLSETLTDCATASEAAEARVEELERRERGLISECNEVEQILGRALGYPPYPEDGPGPPGDICVGEHVPVSIAWTAAKTLAFTEIKVAALEAALRELLDVAERIRGGDSNLDPEQWYAIRDYCRSMLRAALDGKEQKT